MKAYLINRLMIPLTLICLVTSVVSDGYRAMGAEIPGRVTGIDGVKLISEYPRNVSVLATNAIGVDQWTDGLLIQSESTTNAVTIAFKVLPDAESAAREFNRLTIMESSGGGGRTPPKVGDQAIMFGPNRIMIRRENVLVTAFTKGHEAHDHQEIEAFIKFIDDKIRSRDAGIVIQSGFPSLER